MMWRKEQEAGELGYWSELPDGRWISVSQHDGKPDDWQWILWESDQEVPQGFRYGFPSPEEAMRNATEWAESQFDHLQV